MIAAAILILRPCVEVETAGLDALEEQIARFDPQLLICSRLSTKYPGGRHTRIELSLHPNPTQPTRVCIGGRYFERSNPALETILGIIDEADRELIQMKGVNI